MKIGIGVGIVSRASPVLRSFVASAAPSGLLALPAWLSIACATTGRSVQVSASSVVSGLGANAARARNVGSGWGLSVEMARTNIALQSEALASWLTMQGTGTASNPNGQTAPSGTSTADQLNWTANDFSGAIWVQSTSASPANTGSIWLLKNGSTTSIDLYDGAGITFDDLLTPTTSWQRAAHTSTAATVNWSVGRANNAIAAGAAWVWGAQTESGKYPTSYIPTAGGTVTRAADVLTCPTPSSIAPRGYFNVDFTFAPNYTQAEFAADHNLVYFDANNRIYLKQSDQTVRLRLGGSDVASGALTWAREDAIRVQAKHVSGSKRLLVSKNGTVVYDSGILTAAAAITLPGSVGILGDGATTPECADLRSFTAYRP